MKNGRVVMLIAVFAAAASGAYVVEWTASGMNYAYSTVYSSDTSARYDANGDGIPDIFVTDSAALRIYSGVSRSLIWTVPSGGYSTIGFPYIANTDGDPAKELVIAAYTYNYPNYAGKFFIYDCASRSLEYSCPQKSGYPSLSVADVDGDGKSEILLLSGATSRTLEVYGWDGADIMEAPESPALERVAAAPNPAAGHVMLSLPASPGGPVEVVDAAGRVVRRLEASGSVAWDCRDDDGTPVPAGNYLYRQGAFRGRVAVVR